MNNNLTLIAMVLDRSGSMSTVRDETISGVNTFLKEQREIPGDCMLHMVQFDDKYEVVHNFKNLKEVKDLNQETYIPRGWTALHDAIGRTIDDVGRKLAETPEEFRPSKVVFVVQTDGHENASHDYAASKIKSMIEHQTQKYSWQFVFMGANQDAVLSGSYLGFAPSLSLTYTHNAAGTSSSYGSASVNIGSYRIGASNSVKAFSDDQRNAAVGGNTTATATPATPVVVTTTTGSKS